MTKFACIADLEDHLSAEFGAADVTVKADLCPADFPGDITVNCFLLARQLRRSPMDIAAAAAAFLAEHSDVTAAECIKAFVNVTLAPAALFEAMVSDCDALLAGVVLPADEQRRVLIEYSAPNTNKPLHLGHVRNNCLGLAAAAMLRRVGHDVVTVNLINDRGIHICKSMLAYQRWGESTTPASKGVKGDHFVGDFYVLYDAALREQVAALRAADPSLSDSSAEELFLKTEVGRAAQQMLVDWEKGDTDVRALWQRMNAWVVAGFEQTYERMGVGFDQVYLESETYALGRDIIEDGLERGVFERLDDGAVIIDLAKEKLGTKVVLRSDGTSVYVTQDIGTTLLKQRHHEPQMQVWIVGDEQIYHFQVLFAILRALGYPWAADLKHMAYGMVNLPSGKMKSREGTVVDADDLFDELSGLARTATLERAGPEPPADLDRRADVISMGALKFMLLKVSPKTTIMFDPEASMRFEGDTGPYVQYAYARISSMLRKAEDGALDGMVDWSVLGMAEERDLALRCGKYAATVQRAAADLDTSALANYLLDLAKAFSRFYRSCPVLTAETPQLRLARLRLSDCVRRILRDGLGVLTINTLESM